MEGNIIFRELFYKIVGGPIFALPKKIELVSCFKELLKILSVFLKGGLLDFILQLWCSVEDCHGRQILVALGVGREGGG